MEYEVVLRRKSTKAEGTHPETRKILACHDQMFHEGGICAHDTRNLQAACDISNYFLKTTTYRYSEIYLQILE